MTRIAIALEQLDEYDPWMNEWIIIPEGSIGDIIWENPARTECRIRWRNIEPSRTEWPELKEINYLYDAVDCSVRIRIEEEAKYDI